jgi:C4-dicarboxylate-specific signal transduction histidine kinase
MSKTIDDFRDFLRPDKERVLFEVASLIKQVLVILKAQLNNHNIEIAVIEEYPNVCINGYPNEFKQVALNIINNAKDALVEKAVEKPLILITVSKENEKSVLKIQDNAGGIPQSVIDKIFDPFFTTKSDEHGTGIGLSIAKTIIEDGINGSLTATNIADGARFVIVV